MEVTSHNQIRVLSLPEGFDIGNYDEVTSTLDALVDDKNVDSVILDCNDMASLNSSGVGVIIFYFKEFEKKGKQLVLCQLNSIVQKVLKTIGFDRKIKIYPTIPEALERISEER